MEKTDQERREMDAVVAVRGGSEEREAKTSRSNGQTSEDQEKILENLALLQSAFVRLQQQQFLQFQMMQYLQAEIIKKQEEEQQQHEGDEKDGKDSDASDGERQELAISPPLPKSNKDVIRLRSPEELQERPNTSPRPHSSIDIITHQDNPSTMDTSSSLAMLERQTEEALNSASRGILTNNLLDDLEFTKERINGDGTSNAAAKHRCRYCGKISGSSSLLQIHIRSHTGERPYKCNICGSGFTTKGNLKVHFERHSEKYPYSPINPSPNHLQKFFNPFMPTTMPNEGSAAQSVSPFPKLDPRNLFPTELMQKFFMSSSPFPSKEGEARPKSVKEENEEIVEPKGRRLSKDSAMSEEEKIKEEPLDCTEPDDKEKSPCPSPDKSEEFEVPQGQVKPGGDAKQQLELGKSNTFLKNLVKVPSASSPSSSSSTSDSLYNDTVLDPAMHAGNYPRPENNDSMWENFIEITSDTYRLQELVNNCDSTAAEPNQCLICKKVLSCRSALQMHYRVHTGDRPYRCKICGHSFTTKGNLKTHMTVHRINPPMRTLHQCPICYQKFSNIFVLQQHIGLHTGGVQTAPEGQTKEMTKDEGPLDVRTSSKQRPPSEEYRPSRPNLRPQSSGELKRMRSPSPPEISPPPQLFPNRFAKGPLLEQMTPSLYGHFFPHNFPPFPPATFPGQQHMLMRNGPLGPNMPPFGFFGGQENNTTTCKICFKTLASNSALEIHYRSHTKDKPFKCSTCDRGFSTKGNMKQHELVHKIRNTTDNSCNSSDDLQSPYQQRINVNSN